MTALLDAHVHLDKYDDGDVASVLGSIDDHDILTFAVSVDPASYRRTAAIAARSPRIVPCFGVHPSEASRYVASLDALVPLLSASPMIGEIGLDHRFADDPREYPAQREVFGFLLDAARAQGKLVNVHCSGAERETAEMLVAHGIERSIIHWYAGSLDDFGALLDSGSYFTVGVEVLHSAHIRTIAATIPDDRLLTETDNPGGQRWLTGDVGHPDILVEVVAEVARVRRTTPADVAALVRRNIARLVADDSNLDPWRALF